MIGDPAALSQQGTHVKDRLRVNLKTQKWIQQNRYGLTAGWISLPVLSNRCRTRLLPDPQPTANPPSVSMQLSTAQQTARGRTIRKGANRCRSSDYPLHSNRRSAPIEPAKQDDIESFATAYLPVNSVRCPSALETPRVIHHVRIDVTRS